MSERKNPTRESRAGGRRGVELVIYARLGWELVFGGEIAAWQRTHQAISRKRK